MITVHVFLCVNVAASRTVNHYIGKDPDAAPMNLPIVPKLSRELSARLGESPRSGRLP